MSLNVLKEQLRQLEPHIHAFLEKAEKMARLREIVQAEYDTLKLELEGMEDYPVSWKGLEEHAKTHIIALQMLLQEARRLIE